MAYTTTELLASIKRRANIPTASGVFSDSELLAMATEELRSYIVPLVLKEREDYWTTTYDVALTSATSYPLPSRAVGAKLRELSVVDSGGREHNIPRVSQADLESVTAGFYLDSLGVRLFLRDSQPPTVLGVTLRMRYFLRPSVLIVTSSAGTVASGSGPWTLSGGYAGLGSSGTYDCIAAGSPFAVRQADFAGSMSGASLTAASLTSVSAGDWISLSDTSPVVQAPVEFHDVLAQKVAVKVLESKGMTEKLGSAREELGRMEADACALITPRVDGEQQRAVGRGGLFRMRW